MLPRASDIASGKRIDKTYIEIHALGEREWVGSMADHSIIEEIAHEIVAGRVLDILTHPSRPTQKIFIVKIRDLFVMVPFVEESDRVFLKTACVSRKTRKKFGGTE